jgi:hypothetical protein
MWYHKCSESKRNKYIKATKNKRKWREDPGAPILKTIHKTIWQPHHDLRPFMYIVRYKPMLII